jgi:hypothetical protein
MSDAPFWWWVVAMVTVSLAVVGFCDVLQLLSRHWGALACG